MTIYNTIKIPVIASPAAEFRQKTFRTRCLSLDILHKRAVPFFFETEKKRVPH